MLSLQELFEVQAFFSGSMISLRIPPEQWYKLRSSVLEPLDTHHVTIVYMPDVAQEVLKASSF